MARQDARGPLTPSPADQIRRFLVAKNNDGVSVFQQRLLRPIGMARSSILHLQSDLKIADEKIDVVAVEWVGAPGRTPIRVHLVAVSLSDLVMSDILRLLAGARVVREWIACNRKISSRVKRLGLEFVMHAVGIGINPLFGRMDHLGALKDELNLWGHIVEIDPFDGLVVRQFFRYVEPTHQESKVLSVLAECLRKQVESSVTSPNVATVGEGRVNRPRAGARLAHTEESKIAAERSTASHSSGRVRRPASSPSPAWPTSRIPGTGSSHRSSRRCGSGESGDPVAPPSSGRPGRCFPIRRTAGYW